MMRMMAGTLGMGFAAAASLSIPSAIAGAIQPNRATGTMQPHCASLH